MRNGPLQVCSPPHAAGPHLSPRQQPVDQFTCRGRSTQLTLLLGPRGWALGNYRKHRRPGFLPRYNDPVQVPQSIERLGGLDITTVDEYTYYAQGTPNLAGASVHGDQLAHRRFGRHRPDKRSGVLAIPNLPEGYYQIHITADGHAPYDGTVVVNAGQITPVTAFLSLQLVQTTFTIAPTSVQDNISVQVNTTFEANVPAPVITTSPSIFDVGGLTEVGQTEQVNLTIEPRSVAALNMDLFFASHPYYSITP